MHVAQSSICATSINQFSLLKDQVDQFQLLNINQIHAHQAIRKYPRMETQPRIVILPNFTTNKMGTRILPEEGCFRALS